VGAAEGFGLVPLLGRATRQNSAQALVDARALMWEGSWLREFVNVRMEPMFWDAVSAQQARLFEAQTRIADFATVPPESRLARLLRRLADSFGLKTSRGVAIGIGITRRDLAAMVGASPYTVSRTLAKWRELDILDAHRKRILIRNPRRLAELAEDAASG
jgi:CRP-like cAMP-binding protein